MRSTNVLISTIALLAACGGGVTSPSVSPDNHERLAIETIPYDALGQNKIVFLRNAATASGVVTLDGAAKTAKVSYSANTRELAAAPGGERIAYSFLLNSAVYDVYVRNLDAPTGTSVGGSVGGGRGAPSWSPDGSTIVFGETIMRFKFPYDRIVSIAPSSGTPKILWEKASNCEFADAPSLSAQSVLLIIHYPQATLPGGACDLSYQKIATKTTTGPVVVRYTASAPTGRLYSPAWSPSGLEIAFLENEQIPPKLPDGNVDSEGHVYERLEPRELRPSATVWVGISYPPLLG